MVRQRRAVICGLAMLLFFCAAPARSTPLGLGASGVPDPLGPLGSPTFLFGFGPQLFTFGPAGQQVTVRFGEDIIKDPFAPLFACGANCLDFVLQAQLVSGPAGATTLLTSMSMDTFGTSSVDVSWVLDHPAYAVPTGADRSASGDVVSFDFAPGVPVGSSVDTTQILVIRTNRTSFSPQNFVGFSATETFAAGVPPVTANGSFSVQAVPEPSTMMLMLGGAALGAFRKRRSAAKSQEPAR
jgi:hypothetical protein